MPPSFLSIVSLSFLPGTERFFFPETSELVSSKLPATWISFRSGARSPGEVGMLFGAGAGAEKGERALVLRLAGVFSPFEPLASSFQMTLP